MRSFLESAAHILRTNPLSAIGAAMLLMLIGIGCFAPWIMPFDPLSSNAAMALKSPGLPHLFGTDSLGRDILSRLIAATRLDLSIGASAVAIALIFGSALGLLAGYFAGPVERIIGGMTDTLMAFPLFVLAMAIVAALGNTVTNIVLATGLINIPLYIRLVRVETNIRKNSGFVAAARLSGNSELRLLFTHIFPNMAPILAVQTSLTMGYAILNAAALSFIGLGVQPPTPEWGIMVSEGASAILSGHWWVVLFPGLMMLAAVFCFNIVGDSLRDLLDPRART